MLRSLLVVAFIGAVAAGAGYLAQRPTIARGEVIAADLLVKNPQFRALECDPQIPIGVDGARFACVAQLPSGAPQRLELTLDRAGAVHEVGDTGKPDPWR